MKRISIFKRLLILVLVFILSINSFAAIVADNDGATFITKAEFDSLKNNFQAQIDNYNTSIDSKIEGAVASYLAGIQVASSKKVSTICYTPDGIYGVVANDQNLQWEEGILAWSAKWIISQSNGKVTSGTSGTNWYWVTATPLAAVEFTKTVINRTSSSMTVGEWKGLLKQKDTMSTVIDMTYVGQFSNGPASPTSTPLVIGWNVGPNTSKGYGTDEVIAGSGWHPQSNKWNLFSNAGASSFDLTQNTDKRTDSYPPTSTGWPWRCVSAGVTHETTATQYTNIQCAINSVSYRRFSNLYNDADWCNDTNSTTGHTRMANIGEAFNGASWKGGWTSSNGSSVNGTDTSLGVGLVSFWPTTIFNETKYAAWSNTDKSRVVKPYFGFDTMITNYNKLYTSAYDVYIDDMIACGATSNSYYTDLGKNHLRINAGVPIAKVEGPCKVELPIKFKDPAVDYDVWIALKPFSSSSNPWSDGVVFDRTKIFTGGFSSTTVAPTGSQNRSIKVKDNTKVYFDIPNGEFYIFIKWYPAVTSTDGGTFMPTDSIVTIKE